MKKQMLLVAVFVLSASNVLAMEERTALRRRLALYDLLSPVLNSENEGVLKDILTRRSLSKAERKMYEGLLERLCEVKKEQEEIEQEEIEQEEIEQEEPVLPVAPAPYDFRQNLRRRSVWGDTFES
ncbi:MAG: hypothetical protein Q8Q25_02830 [bacterium]|nr:hypothetical protein [bacterium]